MLDQSMKLRLRRVPFVASLYRNLRLMPAWFRYLGDLARFASLARQETRFPLSLGNLQPSLKDRTTGTGFDQHYIYHPAWAARIVAEIGPDFHVDISSSLTFCTLVSAFVPVRFYDYRPAELNLSDLESLPSDLMALPFADNSIRSLSCMHVVEHVGLGRYGDPLDPDGDLKAVAELRRVLAPGGDLLFVVPTGRSRLMFNTHRIYSHAQVLGLFPGLELVEFSLVPDAGGLIRQAAPELADRQEYGCGCFWFRKPQEEVKCGFFMP